MEWINVKDRLPEKDEIVLVYFDGGVATSYWFDRDWETDSPVWSYTGLGGDPTYWCPIPEMPE